MKMKMRSSLAFILTVCSLGEDIEVGMSGETRALLNSNDYPSAEMGVDGSFPMQKYLPEHSPKYEQYMDGCFSAYNKEDCLESENTRSELNRNQPSRMVNFTSAGYAKVKAPPSVMSILLKLWEQKDSATEEPWGGADTYTNHWESSMDLLSVQELSRTDEKVIQGQVGDALRDWIGGNTELIPTSVYGIRIYRSDSILAPHVDRLPLVISAIIQVAQDVDEPWPLEVIDHSGKAVNVTMEPGEMIFYESHSIIHGRPYPLQGRYYANVFVHFEPVGYTQWIVNELGRLPDFEDHAQLLFDEEVLKAQQEVPKEPTSSPPSLPPYIEEGSEEAARWRQEFAFVRKGPAEEETTSESGTPGNGITHRLAARGNLQKLIKAVEDDPESVNAMDANGWRPLHEAARSGHSEVVKHLLDNGADVNARTNKGKGATPLWWAEQNFPDDHEVIRLLKEKGAESIPPNGRRKKPDVA